MLNFLRRKGVFEVSSFLQWSVVLACVLLSPVLTGRARAGDPAWMYNRPVKLDNSGRPIYNSWESRERQRQTRSSDRSVSVTTGTPSAIPVNTGQAVTVQTSGDTQALPPQQVNTMSIPETSSPNSTYYPVNPTTRAAGDSAINPRPTPIVQVNQEPVQVNTSSSPSP